MKVFISWSGAISHTVALALKEWLPNVLQALDCFVSSVDIAKGSRWPEEIASELDASSFGIVCVTPDNVGSPWLNFEAGALSKSVEATAYVVPFLHGLSKSDVQPPLGHFQSVTGEAGDVLLLLQSLNAAAGSPLTDDRLRRTADVWWPRLQESLDTLRVTPIQSSTARRSDRELLEEILANVRGAARAAAPVTAPKRDFSAAAERYLEKQLAHRLLLVRTLLEPLAPEAKLDIDAANGVVRVMSARPLPADVADTMRNVLLKYDLQLPILFELQSVDDSEAPS